MEIPLLLLIPFVLIGLGILAVPIVMVVALWRFYRTQAPARWGLPDDRDVRVLWQRWGLTFQPQGEVSVRHAAGFLADRGSDRGAEQYGLPAGHGVRLVATGAHAGRRFTVADVYDVALHEDGQSGESGAPVVRVQALAVLPTPTTAGTVIVGRESALTALATTAGLRDVELESEEFNRTFRVKGDRELAYAVLTPQVMEALLEADREGRGVLLQLRDGLLCVHEVGVGGLATGGQAVAGDALLRTFTRIVEGTRPETWPASVERTVQPAPVPVDPRAPGEAPLVDERRWAGLSPRALALLILAVFAIGALPVLLMFLRVGAGFLDVVRGFG